MSAVCTVQPPTALVDGDFRRVARAREVRRQRRDGLEPDRRACPGIVGESRDRVRQLVYDVQEPAVRMEVEVARAGPRRNLNVRNAVRHELASARVDAPGPHPVEPQVGAHSEPSADVEAHLVCVRLFLPGGIGASTRRSEHVRYGPHVAVRLDRQQ